MLWDDSRRRWRVKLKPRGRRASGQEALKLTILGGSVDVQIQAVLALVLNVGGHGVQVVGEPDGHHDLWHGVVDVLRAHGHEVGGVFDPRPRGRLLGRHETLVAHGRGGVGDPQILIDGSEHLTGHGNPKASQLPKLGGHCWVEFLARGLCERPAGT